jgi:hypothetical protein
MSVRELSLRSGKAASDASFDTSVLLNLTGGHIMAGLSLVKFARLKNAGYLEIINKNQP